jgi:hypothetical protein
MRLVKMMEGKEDEHQDEMNPDDLWKQFSKDGKMTFD